MRSVIPENMQNRNNLSLTNRILQISIDIVIISEIWIDCAMLRNLKNRPYRDKSCRFRVIDLFSLSYLTANFWFIFVSILQAMLEIRHFVKCLLLDVRESKNFTNRLL